ncbi:N-methyl-L-tryptophan oxidase [Leucobacter alluvii]|uniref:N-methyl-L-tryptophan oxidase n=1 Tax=Leucobacter alluvii TaxID=340321 RepID=A0ABP5N4D6_9MICO
MSEPTDHLVIGGGAMGLATARQLASRGASVRLLERFEAHHTRGASHGSTRNLNNAYDEPAYLDLFDEATTLWRALESETRTELLGLHGLVTHGDEGVVASAHDALVARGAAVSLLSADEAGTRWPGMRFAGGALFSAEAGIVHAARALAALETSAIRHGAIVERGEQVLRIEPSANDARVRVTSRGREGGIRELVADHVTVAAGAWTAPLLDGLIELPSLTVTEEHPAHFAPRSASIPWPSFNHLLPPEPLASFAAPVYGMPSPGEGVKVGFHRVGETVDPDARTFRASDAQRATLRRYVTEWFPGLDPDSPTEISCTYTSTDSGRFVLDTVGPITVGAGFSGHGFKFTPAIGRVLADAAMGHSTPPEFFRLAAHGAR